MDLMFENGQDEEWGEKMDRQLHRLLIIKRKLVRPNMDWKGQVRILEIGGLLLAIFESLVSPVWNACRSLLKI
jgi:hypothetical protein